MEVTIYGTPNCSYCDQAKQLLMQKNIEYRYRDIQEDQTAFADLCLLGSFRTVPQIIVDGEHIGGYTELVKVLNES